MTKAATSVPFRVWRCDLWEHKKTSGLWPLSYSIMQYAVSKNILGVLEKSPRMIASRFRDTTESDVIESIGELQQRRIARWWPDLEILWIVSALDEQSFGGKADVAASRLIGTFPKEVQDAICCEYGDRLGFYSVSEITIGVGAFPQEQDQDQNQEQDTNLAAFALTEETQVDAVIDHMRAVRKQLTGREGFRSIHPAQTLHIRILLRSGVPVAELCRALDARLWDARRHPKRKGFVGFDCFAPERWGWSCELVEEMEQASGPDVPDITELARLEREKWNA